MSVTGESLSPPIMGVPQAQKMPAALNREPSQQDLEIARQLQSFSSQGETRHDHMRPDQSGAPEAQRSPNYQSPEGRSQADAGAVPQDPDQTQQHPQTHDAHSAVSFTSLQHNPAQPPPGSGSSSVGQMCSNCGTAKTPLWRRSPAGAVICNACGLYYKARNQMRPVGLKRGATAGPPLAYQTGSLREDSASSMQGGATYVSADQSTNGTCPGGGRCNGTGGHDGCNGCPAYNNRISKTAQVALRQASNGPVDSTNGDSSLLQAPAMQQSVIIACQNCGTTITPLWRRDEAGNTICNACGTSSLGISLF
jgi:GATA-binding protein